MNLYELEKKFHEVFGLPPHKELFDGHLIDMYDLTEENYLRLIYVLGLPHIDVLSEIRLNEDSDFNEFKERILKAVIHEYEFGRLEKEYVTGLF